MHEASDKDKSCHKKWFRSELQADGLAWKNEWEMPASLAELVVQTAFGSNRACLRSAQLLFIAVPHTYSSLGDRTFTVAVHWAWNTLPSHIRHISSTHVFSKYLKSFLWPGISWQRTWNSCSRQQLFGDIWKPVCLTALFAPTTLFDCVMHSWST